MQSLVDVSRGDLMRLCHKFKDNKPKLRQYLVALFAKRENIALFGWFINQSYNTLETPDFHKQIYNLITDLSVPYIAIGAPRGHAKSTVVDFTILRKELLFSGIVFFSREMLLKVRGFFTDLLR